MKLGLRAAASVVAALGLVSGSLTGAAADTSTAAGAPQPAAGQTMNLPIVRQNVPLPNGVQVMPGTCTWTVDATTLLCTVKMDGGHIQVATIRPDGSHLQCLTCGLSVSGEPYKLFPFPDGKRFFVGTIASAEASASGGASIAPNVGECAPSLLDCQHATLTKVTLPTIVGDMQDREPRISPDGLHYAWTVVRADGFLLLLGDLAPTPTGYAVTGVRVLNPESTPRTAAQWEARLALSEIKSFDGPDRIVFQSTRSGGLSTNDWELDLNSGRVTQLTHSLEWTEDAQWDPSHQFLAVLSSRHLHNLRRTFALAATPALMDGAARVFLAPAELVPASEREHLLEPWITTMAQEKDGGPYGGGEELNDKGGGWAADISPAPWSPAGNRIVWVDIHSGGATRLNVGTFPTLKTHLRSCDASNAECRTPTPAWAPLVQSYPLLAPGLHVIPGPRGGSATLVYSTIGGPLNTVLFANFTDTNGRTYNGTIRQVGGSVFGLSGTLDEDITISGTATGHSIAHATSQKGTVCGTVDTTLNGQHLHTNIGQWSGHCGFPLPTICPDGADADATDNGTCSEDQQPDRWLAPPWTS